MRRTAVSLMAIAAAMMMSPATFAKSGETSAQSATAAKEWWPKSLDLTPLRQNEAQSSPYGADFDYAREFATLDSMR